MVQDKKLPTLLKFIIKFILKIAEWKDMLSYLFIKKKYFFKLNFIRENIKDEFQIN